MAQQAEDTERRLWTWMADREEAEQKREPGRSLKQRRAGENPGHRTALNGGIAK